MVALRPAASAAARGWYRVGQAGALLLWPLLALGGAVLALAARLTIWLAEYSEKNQ